MGAVPCKSSVIFCLPPIPAVPSLLTAAEDVVGGLKLDLAGPLAQEEDVAEIRKGDAVRDRASVSTGPPDRIRATCARRDDKEKPDRVATANRAFVLVKCGEKVGNFRGQTRRRLPAKRERMRLTYIVRDLLDATCQLLQATMVGGNTCSKSRKGSDRGLVVLWAAGPGHGTSTPDW